MSQHQSAKDRKVTQVSLEEITNLHRQEVREVILTPNGKWLVFIVTYLQLCYTQIYFAHFTLHLF